MASNSNKKTNYNKTPSIKPEKPSWIRSCFGFVSSHKTRAKADRSLDQATTGGARRFKGLGILRGVFKKPWAKKRDKTTSLKATKTREKLVEEGRRRSLAIEVVEGTTAGKVVVVVGKNQKSLLVDDEFHEAQWPIGGRIKKEFDCAKDPPTCQNLSKSTKEDTSISHKIKADSKELAKPEELPNLARVSSKRSRRQNTKRSNIDDIIGLSILVTILMVMLICGRLCAILCTAIWLYCMPRLTKTTKNNKNNEEGNNSSVKLESERKEVVLKGFLERKHISFAKVS